MLYSGEAEVLLHVLIDRKMFVSRNTLVLTSHQQCMYSTVAKVACFGHVPAVSTRALVIQVLPLLAATRDLAMSAASKASMPPQPDQHAISAGVPHPHADVCS